MLNKCKPAYKYVGCLRYVYKLPRYLSIIVINQTPCVTFIKSEQCSRVIQQYPSTNIRNISIIAFELFQLFEEESLAIDTLGLFTICPIRKHFILYHLDFTFLHHFVKRGTEVQPVIFYSLQVLLSHYYHSIATCKKPNNHLSLEYKQVLYTISY